MSFQEKMIGLINSKKTIKYLFYGFLFFLLLDVSITLYELIFLPGISEKNLIARLFISKYGNVLGLLIAVPTQVITLSIFLIYIYIFLSIILYLLNKVLKKKEEHKINVFYLSLIIVFLFATLLHMKAVVNNLYILLASMQAIPFLMENTMK